jgi:hypothetical protein
MDDFTPAPTAMTESNAPTENAAPTATLDPTLESQINAANAATGTPPALPDYLTVGELQAADAEPIATPDEKPTFEAPAVAVNDAQPEVPQASKATEQPPEAFGHAPVAAAGKTVHAEVSMIQDETGAVVSGVVPAGLLAEMKAELAELKARTAPYLHHLFARAEEVLAEF